MKRSGTALALAALFAVSALAVAASPARSDGRIRIAYDLVGIPIPILHSYVAGVLAGHRASAKLYGRPEIVCTPPGTSLAEKSIAVLLHLRGAPEDRALPAGLVVLRALGKTYRCRGV